MPSQSPTKECVYIVVGSTCIYATNLDLLFLLDASFSIENFDLLKDQLATLIENSFPRNSRLSVIQYATESQILFNFDYNNGRKELGNLIRNMDQLGKKTIFIAGSSNLHVNDYAIVA